MHTQIIGLDTSPPITQQKKLLTVGISTGNVFVSFTNCFVTDEEPLTVEASYTFASTAATY